MRIGIHICANNTFAQRSFGQGDYEINEYRNVDAVVEDATVCITIGNAAKPMDWSGIPEITDQVSLKTNDGYSMIVEMTQMSDDMQMFKGKVIHGLFPENQADWINVGDLVELSRKKIAGIHKK